MSCYYYSFKPQILVPRKIRIFRSSCFRKNDMEWTQVKLNIHRHRRHYLAHRTLIGKTAYFLIFRNIYYDCLT